MIALHLIILVQFVDHISSIRDRYACLTFVIPPYMLAGQQYWYFAESLLLLNKVSLIISKPSFFISIIINKKGSSANFFKSSLTKHYENLFLLNKMHKRKVWQIQLHTAKIKRKTIDFLPPFRIARLYVYFCHHELKNNNW